MSTGPVAATPSDGGPTTVAGYEIISKIGEDAVGTVFKARQLSTDRLVALRVVNAKMAADKPFMDSFLRDARVAAGLKHPNIIEVFDAGTAEGQAYLAMELVAGRDLKKLLATTGALEQQRALEISRDIAQALDCIHQAGVVHRNVRPENIFVGSDGAARLTGLGAAHRPNVGVLGQPGSGAAREAADYVSPEEARGGEGIDARADIYSVGATLYHMLTGDPPFTGKAAADVLSKHATTPAPNPCAAAPGVSAHAAALIHRTMAKDPANRYGSAHELLADLKLLLGWAAEPAAPRSSAPDTRADLGLRDKEPPRKSSAPDIRADLGLTDEEPPRKRRGLVVGVLGLVLLAAAVGLGVMFFPESTPEQSPEEQEFAAVRKWVADNPGKYHAAQEKYRRLQSTVTDPDRKRRIKETLLELEVERGRAADAFFAELESTANKLAERRDYGKAVGLYRNLPPQFKDGLLPRASEAIAALEAASKSALAMHIKRARLLLEEEDPIAGLEELGRADDLIRGEPPREVDELRANLERAMVWRALIAKERLEKVLDAVDALVAEGKLADAAGKALAVAKDAESAYAPATAKSIAGIGAALRQAASDSKKQVEALTPDGHMAAAILALAAGRPAEMGTAITRADAHEFRVRYLDKLDVLKKQIARREAEERRRQLVQLTAFRATLPGELKKRNYKPLLARLDQIIADPDLSAIREHAEADRRILARLAATLDRIRLNVRTEAGKAKKTPTRRRGIPATITKYDPATDTVTFSAGAPEAIASMRAVDLASLLGLDPGPAEQHHESVALLLIASGEPKAAESHAAKVAQRTNLDRLNTMLAPPGRADDEIDVAAAVEDDTTDEAASTEKVVKKVLGEDWKPAEEPEQFKGSLIPGYDDAFLKQGRWAEGRAYYTEQLTGVLSAKKPDLLAAQRLLYAQDVCQLFPAVAGGAPSPEDRPFAQWLLAHPSLVRKLVAAVRPGDNPAGIFRMLYLIKTKAPVKKVTHENLMVAFAIVYDDKVKNLDVKGDAGKAVSHFRYCVRNAERFPGDPRTIPVVLLKYMVNNVVSSEERKWATSRHGRGTSPTLLYSGIKYDMKAFKKGASESRNWQLREKAGYTLKSIKNYGGICVDQAYYTVGVSRSWGIPATVFSGREVEKGIGHAWASTVKRRGSRWTWIDAGRYGGRRGYVTGTTVNPQTGHRVSDRDCWLEAQAAGLSEDRRQRSRLFLQAALLMEGQKNDAQAIKYLRLAVALNPYSADAWKTVARFCAERKLKPAAGAALYRMMLVRFKNHPVLTKQVLDQVRSLAPKSDAKRHLMLFEITWDQYRRRHPDVAAVVMAEKADYLMTLGKPGMALEAYRDVVMRYRKNGPVVEMLLPRAEEAYRSRKKVKRYIDLVERVMGAYSRLRNSSMRNMAYQRTTYYKVATHLRDLYGEVGNDKKRRRYEELTEPIHK